MSVQESSIPANARNFGVAVRTDRPVTVASGPPVEVVRGHTGLSAYEVAVLDGFVGTVAEWRASLQGGPNVVALAYNDWPPVNPVSNTLYLRLALT